MMSGNVERRPTGSSGTANQEAENARELHHQDSSTVAGSHPSGAGGLSWADALAGSKRTPPPTIGPITPADGQTRYAATALAEEAERVRTAVEGTRNHTLNEAAFALAQLIATGQLGEVEVRDTLRVAAHAAGLGATETERTIASGFKKGKLLPRDLSGVRELAAPNVTEVASLGLPEGGATQVVTDPAEAARLLFEREVAEEVRRQDVRIAARAYVAARDNPPRPFNAGTLAEILARPPEPEARVVGIMPWGASLTVVAPAKTGKSTTVLNLSRSLLDGRPFLGRAVRPVAVGNRVGYLNYEVSATQLARWARDHGIDRDRFYVANFRGEPNPLATSASRAALADLLRSQNVETLIVDPFGRAYTGQSQNDPGEVGAWLSDLDRFARAEVGAIDLVLVVHAGWQHERARGGSALADWPDSILTLTRDDNGNRFVSGEGRDVDLEEDRLDFDPDTRTLSLSGMGGRKATAREKRDADTRQRILAVLGRDENRDGLSGEELARLADTDKKGEFVGIRDALVDAGHIGKRKRPGRGGGWLYALPDAEPHRTPPNPTDR